LKSTVHVVSGDIRTIADLLCNFRAFTARHGLDWHTFLRNEVRASPEFIEAIENAAKLTDPGGPKRRKQERRL
jgi:hypothetical protein